MKVGALATLCGCLILSGCTRSEVNEVAPVKYTSGDNPAEIALKTTANVMIAVVAVPVVAAGMFIAAVGSNGGSLSGGASSKGVTISH